MKKVIAIYYEKPEFPRESNIYDTGLILELEDGTKLYGMTTDVLQPFREVIKP